MVYIRVKDPDTGHEFDLPEDHRLIRKNLVKPVKADRYPPASLPRPAKHRIPKSPAAKPDQSAPSTEAPQDATEKE